MSTDRTTLIEGAAAREAIATRSIQALARAQAAIGTLIARNDTEAQVFADQVDRMRTLADHHRSAAEAAATERRRHQELATTEDLA
jgi:hypothetical protein